MSYRSKYETIKCLEENIGENLHDLGLVNELLNHDDKTEIHGKKPDKLDFISLSQVSVKDSVKRRKRQKKIIKENQKTNYSQTIFVNHIFDERRIRNSLKTLRAEQ